MLLAPLIFLAWGSFLNSLAYRLLHPSTLFIKRSFCPDCKQIIYWYDNIPIISWLILRARCRHCQQQISWLYPCIEILSLLTFMLLWHKAPQIYLPAYFIFFSALIITIRTDLDQMLISRFVTLYLIPATFIAAYFGKLPISINSSIIGACFGYLLLWCVNKSFSLLTGKEGMGQGDLDLLAFIGSCTGIIGSWIALSIGSLLGCIAAFLYVIFTKKQIKKLPFGPFLAIGSITFLLWQKPLTLLFIGQL